MVEVITPGFYTTVQDLGRKGFHEYGVPYSGVMDTESTKIANALLANNVNAAVLEITMTGPTLKFNSNTSISITGADISPKLNNIPIHLNHSIKIKPGDILSFGKLNYGFRSYLAVSGGFQTDEVMNSRSMYYNITSQVLLKRGDTLPILEQAKYKTTSNSTIKINKDHFNNETLLVYKGSEFDNLLKTQQKQLLSQSYTISKDNNRMAYQLDNTIENKLKPIITSLVQPGTIQLPPSGKLIVLMRDGQTAGGYPRVLQLSENSINKLSQKFTNQVIKFRLIE